MLRRQSVQRKIANWWSVRCQKEGMAMLIVDTLQQLTIIWRYFYYTTTVFVSTSTHTQFRCWMQNWANNCSKLPLLLCGNAEQRKQQWQVHTTAVIDWCITICKKIIWLHLVFHRKMWPMLCIVSSIALVGRINNLFWGLVMSLVSWWVVSVS